MGKPAMGAGGAGVFAPEWEGRTGGAMRLEQSYRAEAGQVRGRLEAWRPAVKVLACLGIITMAFGLAYAWNSDVDIRSLGALGYPGFFLLSFLSAATVFVPVPGLLAAAGGGVWWNPVMVGLAAGLGAGSGELLGYAAGRAGEAPIKVFLGRRWESAEVCLRRFGFWAILGLAAMPNPFFDAVGVAAGALAYPAPRFWLAAALGNCLKYVAVAHLGGMVAWPAG